MQIETLEDLYKLAFGGKAKAAQWFGVTPGAVSQWSRIPTRYHRKLMAYAKRKRWKVADRVYEGEES